MMIIRMKWILDPALTEALCFLLTLRVAFAHFRFRVHNSIPKTKRRSA